MTAGVNREEVMMFKGIKIILLPLLLIPILALFSFYGCESATTTPNGAGSTIEPGGMSEQQLEQLVSNAVNNFAGADTFKFIMDMDVIADISGGFQSGRMTMGADYNGASNQVTNEMQMMMDMLMETEGMGQQSFSMNMDYEIYILEDWLYMKMSYSGMTQWVKLTMSPELEEELGINTVNQQLEPLDSPADIEYLGITSVDGDECHVFAITPNMNELASYLNQQNMQDSAIDWGEIDDIYSVFKEFTYKCYITTDTNYLRKMETNMVVEMSAEQAGASSSDFDTMVMTIKADMKIYDYNVPFSVTLPDEAENAMEVSEDMLF